MDRVGSAVHQGTRHQFDAALPGPAARIEATIEELLVADQELRQRVEVLLSQRAATELVRQRYRDLFDFAPDGYLVTSPTGTIREANLAAAHLLGLASDLIVGKPLAVFVPIEQRPAFRARLLEALQIGGASTWEMGVRRRDARVIPVEARVNVTAPPGDGLPLLRWLLRDVTERKESEARIRELSRDLETRIAECTGPLRDTIRARDIFLASVAGDLRNPLLLIEDQVRFLAERVVIDQPAGPLDVANGLAMIAALAGEAVASVEELRDAARLRAGLPLDLDCRPTDLVDLICRLLAHYQQTTERHHLRIDAAVSTASGMVGHWDEPRLERILGNLILDAIKHSPEGGELTIYLAKHLQYGAPWAHVAIVDPAVGTEPDVPGSEATGEFPTERVTGRIRGEGLGLTGARQILAQHGGSLSVWRGAGAGTTRSVWLPFRAPAVGGPIKNLDLEV